MATMMFTPIVEVNQDKTITVPAEVTSKFRPTDRFVVWPQGDMLILKRVKPLRVTDVVANASEENPPLTLDEIDEIVHAVRQQRRQD
jgi:hypothetical protein